DAAPLDDARGDLQRGRAVHGRERAGERGVGVDAREELAVRVELQHAERVLGERPTLVLDLWPREEGLGYEDEDRLALVDLAIAGLLQPIASELGHPLVPVVLEARMLP